MSAIRQLCSTRLLAIFVALAPACLGAATYNITTFAEVDPEHCTLREALLAAADDTTHGECVGDAGPDEIVLQAQGSLFEPYSLTGGPITLSGRDLLVRGAIADRPFDYVIDLGSSQRFLLATTGADLALESLQIVNGSVAGNGGAVAAVNSDLSLRRVYIEGSGAIRGGAISFEATTPYTLDLESVDFFQNTAADDVAPRGGALFVDLLGGGTVRLVKVAFNTNYVTAPAAAVAGPAAERRGGGLDLSAIGVVSLELRHVAFQGNEIEAPADARGGGASIFVSGAGAILAEDIQVVGNYVTPVAGNAVPGLFLSVIGPSLDLRRLHAAANVFGNDFVTSQVELDVGIGTAATISDVLVVSGNSSGLRLGTNGGSCSLLAGNLTVVGHAFDGLSLEEANTCTLRVENSIVWDNAFSIGDHDDVVIVAGTPEVAQSMVGVDPHFVDYFGQNFALASDSDAIDAGDQSFASVGPFDVGHGARILGAQVDLGAYESGAVFEDDFEYGDYYAWDVPFP